jgi:hypothetical protein
MWSKPSPSNSLHNGSRQSQHPQEPGGTALAAPASSWPLPLHPDTCLLGQLGGMFFSILGKQGLSQSVHTSKRQLKEFLLDYIARNNENPSPFVWDKGPERLQHIIEARKEYQATHARKLRTRRRTPNTIEKRCSGNFFRNGQQSEFKMAASGFVTSTLTCTNCPRTSVNGCGRDSYRVAWWHSMTMECE